MENFVYIIFFLLSAVVIVNVIKSVILLMCKDNGSKCELVISLDDSCENPETAIRNTVLYHEWSDNSRNKYSGIYCIYNGENEESREICRRVCEDYPFTHYINNPDFFINTARKP